MPWLKTALAVAAGFFGRLLASSLGLIGVNPQRLLGRKEVENAQLKKELEAERAADDALRDKSDVVRGFDRKAGT